VCVRADIARLPFATGSVDAIHAGAAIHCWPNPQAALAEISRVLRPGGVFVASTFLNPWAPLGELVGDETVRPLAQVRGGVERAPWGGAVVAAGVPEAGGWRWCREVETPTGTPNAEARRPRPHGSPRRAPARRRRRPWGRAGGSHTVSGRRGSCGSWRTASGWPGAAASAAAASSCSPPRSPAGAGATAAAAARRRRAGATTSPWRPSLPLHTTEPCLLPLPRAPLLTRALPLPPAPPRPAPPPKALNPFSGAGGTIRYWDEGELVDLVNSVGLTGYERDRTRMFVMFAARKPGGREEGGAAGSA
jgi:hypothetical protein